MIIINPQLKDKKYVIADHKIFSHLFRWNEELRECEQISNFWWEFDNEYNLIIETLLDGEQLKNKVLEILNKQKTFAEIIISKEQQKLASINKMLKGVKNG